MGTLGHQHARISPTAHYTAYVWYRAGMSFAPLATPLGRALHVALRPMNLAYERLGTRPDLDMMLLARHRVLDAWLEAEIASGRVGQVLEIAAGLSPRGATFVRRHPGLVYVEGDLPDMAADKRRRLAGAGLLAEGHRIVTLDALAAEGPTSLAEVAARELDPERGLAIVTEGLLSYFDLAAVRGMWARFAALLARHGSGAYLADLNLAGDLAGMRSGLVFRRLLEVFARGRVHLHFEGEAEARAALALAGFDDVELRTPQEVAGVDVPGRDRRHVVRLLRARATRAG